MSTTIRDVSLAALAERHPDSAAALADAYQTYSATPAFTAAAALNMVAGSTLTQWYPGIAWDLLDSWGIGSTQETAVVTPVSVGEVRLRFMVTREQTFDGISTYTVWLVPMPAGGWPADPAATDWVSSAILVEDPATVGGYLQRAADVSVSTGFTGVAADLGDGTYDLSEMLNLVAIDNGDGTYSLSIANDPNATVASKHVSVGAGPTLIAPDDPYAHPIKTVTIRCTTDFYLGGPNVSPANGYPAAANRDLAISDYEGDLYVCVDPANNGATAYVLWPGV